MARFFDITAVTTSTALDADRVGTAAFTVTNATAASIRGEAVVVPQPGAEGARYDIDRPSRHFDPGATESVTVEITAPPEMPAGTYGFQLRMILGGGIPEEQYDDGPVVRFAVVEAPPPPPPPPEPKPKPGIPWWVFALIAAVVLVVIGVVAYLLWPREPTPIGPIPATEARDHVGEQAIVCGTVVATEWVFLENGHPTFLNFVAPYPSQPFNVVIWGEQRRAWPLSGKPDVVFRGRNVCVTGLIEAYRGWAQIQNVSMDDIELQP